MSSRWCALVLCAGMLGACQSVDPVSQSPDPLFGEVTARNKLVQVVNPDPVYTADASDPGDNGERGAKAVDRYQKGTVKDTKRITTSSSVGGNGGGGGGSN